MTGLLVLDRLGRTDIAGRLPGWFGVPTLEVVLSLVPTTGVDRLRVVDLTGDPTVQRFLRDHPVVSEVRSGRRGMLLNALSSSADWVMVDPLPIEPGPLAIDLMGGTGGAAWALPNGEWTGWARRGSNASATLPIDRLLADRTADFRGFAIRHVGPTAPLHGAHPSGRLVTALELLNDLPHHLLPSTAREIAPGVFAGRGARIHPSVRIDGPAWIGDGARIGRDVRLEGGVVVHDRTVVEPRTTLHSTVVESGTWVRADQRIEGAWLDGESWWSATDSGTGLGLRIDRKLARRPSTPIVDATRRIGLREAA